MDTTTDSPLCSYIADDAPWSAYSLEVLRAQCVQRTLSPAGDANELRFRLEDYHQRHKREERAHFPWRTAKDMLYIRAETAAHGHNFLLLQVRDRSCFRQGRIEKHFNLVERSAKYFTDFANVTIGRNPTCNCTFKNTKTEQGYSNWTCPHIIYVLKYILGCPNPLRFQAAFLFEELVKIFQHSVVFDLMDRYDLRHPKPNAEQSVPSLNYRPSHPTYPTQICTMCFRFINFDEATKPCIACGLPVHRSCLKLMSGYFCFSRKEAVDKSCSIHHDINAWTYTLIVSGRGAGRSEDRYRPQRAEAIEAAVKESDDVEMEDVCDTDFWLEGDDVDMEDGSDSDSENGAQQAGDGVDKQEDNPDPAATATGIITANLTGEEQREMTLSIRLGRPVDHQQDNSRPASTTSGISPASDTTVTGNDQREMTLSIRLGRFVKDQE